MNEITSTKSRTKKQVKWMAIKKRGIKGGNKPQHLRLSVQHLQLHVKLLLAPKELQHLDQKGKQGQQGR